MIIDNHKEEITGLVEELNKRAINTSFMEDILAKGAKINPYTHIAILDLYLTPEENNFEDAISSVQKLSEAIRVPYQVLIWTKHKEKFEKFCSEVVRIESSLENPPIRIEKIDAHKMTEPLSSKEVADVVDKIEKSIAKFMEDTPNITAFLNFLELFRNESTKIWNIFTQNKPTENRIEILEKQLGSIMKNLDISQGYDESGKGMLHIQSKIIEDRLTHEPLKYTCEAIKIPDTIKDSLNEYLMLHKIEKGNEDSVLDKPGTIIKKSNNDFLIEKLLDIPKMEEKNFKVKYQNDSGTLEIDNGKVNKIEISQVSVIVTPYCDYSNGKHYNQLLLPVIHMVLPTSMSKRVHTNLLKCVKNNFKKVIIKKELVLIYEPRQLYTEKHDLSLVGRDIMPYYLSKEVVNEIQSEIGASINRVGISTI